MKCCHGTTLVQELFLHETPHSKEMKYDGVCLCTVITKIQAMKSNENYAFNKVFLAMDIRPCIKTCLSF